VIPLFAAGPAYDPRNGSPSNAATLFETLGVVTVERIYSRRRSGHGRNVLSPGNGVTEPFPGCLYRQFVPALEVTPPEVFSTQRGVLVPC
jgi:hypothetical protein